MRDAMVSLASSLTCCTLFLAALISAMGMQAFAKTGAPENVQRAALPASPSLPRKALRVQLRWYHQSQFAGFYIAKARRYFEAEGLNVDLIVGGPGINPVEELQAGRADVAVSWLANAWALSSSGPQVTNVAQIFSGSAFAIVCRMSAGVYTPHDIKGKHVGVWNLGDQFVIQKMLRRLGIPLSSVKLVPQLPDGKDIVSGKLPCGSAMTYNEYWQIMQAGVPPGDLLLVSPEEFGIPHIEDGLYVVTERLSAPGFKQDLVRLVRALRRGWQEAKTAPTLAIETVMRRSQSLDREHQRHMLDIVNSIVADGSGFGELSLARYQRAASTLIPQSRLAPAPTIWTHGVWSLSRADIAKSSTFTVATRHYVKTLLEQPAFKMLMLFGVVVFALSGALEAINRGYDIWGMLILAALCSVGGGTLRDLLIGGDRLPFFYITDPVYPLSIASIVVVAAVVSSFDEDLHERQGFKTVKTYADIIGFSILSAAGALISISSDLPWFWAPVMAALSCAGGGMLRDIVINREPATFKGVIYEEVAILGGFVIAAGLMIANHFEATPQPIYLTVAACISIVICCRVIIYRQGMSYPDRALIGLLRRAVRKEAAAKPPVE